MAGEGDAAEATLHAQAPASGLLGLLGLFGRFAGELDDEVLALLFTACHPRVPAASQVALAPAC